MIFDTDIFIWAQRGNEKAAKLMEKSEDRFLSIQTYMELFQCAKNKTQHQYVKDFLSSVFGSFLLTHPYYKRGGSKSHLKFWVAGIARVRAIVSVLRGVDFYQSFIEPLISTAAMKRENRHLITL